MTDYCRMTDPIDEQLLGHLLGVLDDHEQQSLDARLEHNEELCRELAAWRRRLAPLEALRPDDEPPPGLAQRTCRLVAAYASVTANSHLAPKCRMSPRPVPPGRSTQVGWFDMVAGAVLSFVAVALVVPAIQSSRFDARLAACQNGLRQFGTALTQYSNYQRDRLTQLANNQRLTNAGLVAASRMKDVYAANSHSAVSDAWLAAQGELGGTRRADALLAGSLTPARPFSNVPLLPSEKIGTGRLTTDTDAVATVSGEAAIPISSRILRVVDDCCEDWPGAWRNGTTGSLRTPLSPADSPLLADAPSADVPGHDLPSHGGRGRNVFYADGRTDFQLRSASRDTSLSAGVSAPIIFVGR